MTIAKTAAGAVLGAEVGDAILAWKGIPYAAAPLGPLRLRLPQPAASWMGVRDATVYGPPSVQAPRQLPGLLAGSELPDPSEDCLYLNVTAPANASGRPVLVWLHGGGYFNGSGTDMAGDGSSFVRSHGAVVVTVNYRLGALGFLAVDGEAHTGAYGLHDQIAALRWVRENIAAFGGDPEQVAVYGLSAGAKSVANLLGSPLTRGLIHRAASSSGGAERVATPRQAASVARRFLRELGGRAELIRSAPVAEILAAQNAIAGGVRATWIWRPALDGLALTARPLDAIAAGSAAGIPLLAQTCAEECAAYQMIAPDTADQTDRILTKNFGSAGCEQILAAYAASRPELANNPAQLRVAVMTDERYGIPTTRLADTQSAYARVWRSRYDGPLNIPPGLGLPEGVLPAVHGSDGIPIWNGGDDLASALHEAWGEFIVGRAPAAAGLPEWPSYTVDRRATMIFDRAGSRMAYDPLGAERAVWDGREWPSGTWWEFDEVE
ncbi:carboxylesterase/lipase family protein [Streptomyces sp. NPDC048291]|uniref:carboxylesterase/lipase family protein n=1 Tax=Streptomyces sp. NPDC048291 TaxID=3365530 RepID=UPI0037157456